jgi:phospholipase C
LGPIQGQRVSSRSLHPLQSESNECRIRKTIHLDAYGEGFRVPALVISPWAKQHFIDHTQYEFASMLRLAEVNFNLPTLGTREIRSNDMMSSFDFNQAPLPPLIEAANFVGPGAVATTSSSVQNSSPGVGVQGIGSLEFYSALAVVVTTEAVVSALVVNYRAKRKSAA